MQTIHVQTINYKNPSEVLGFLADLRKQDCSCNIRVHILDNSGDLSPESCERYGASYYCVKENIGFGRGHNYLFNQYAASNDDFLIIANNDIALESDSAVSNLVALLSHTSSDIISPSILYENGIWFSGSELGRITGEICTLRKPVVAQSIRECVYVPGTFMITRIGLFRRLSGFDERMFMYSEDVDFCIRASRRFLAKISVCSVGITHRVGSGYSGSYTDLYIKENTINRLLTLVENRLGVWPFNVLYFFAKYYVARTGQLLIARRLSLLMSLWKTLPRAIAIIVGK